MSSSLSRLKSSPGNNTKLNKDIENDISERIKSNVSSISPRIRSTTAICPGTKPAAKNQTLTSTGLREFDSILSGGQPLGSIILINEDRFLNFGLLFAQYWSSEAIAQNQTLCLITTKKENDHDITSLPTSYSSTLQEDDLIYEDEFSTQDAELFLQSLPRNLHLAKEFQKQQQQEKVLSSFQGLTVLEEEEEGENYSDENEEGLTIAWQYRKSIQKSRSGLSSALKGQRKRFDQKRQTVFCHSYDLNSRMIDQYPDNVLPNVKVLSDLSSSSFYEFHSVLRNFIQDQTSSEKGTVLRILLYHPKPLHSCLLALTPLLSYVREQSLPVVFFVCVQPWKMSSPQVKLGFERACDSVFTIKGITNRRGEFQNKSSPFGADLEALLKIQKINFCANDYYASQFKFTNSIPAYVYSIKRESSRKLRLHMLHLPPCGEDDDTGTTIRSTTKQKVAASGPCSNQFDF